MAEAAHELRLQLRRVREPMGASLAVAFALFCGALTVRSTQLTLTLALLILLVGVRGQSRTAGLMTLWSYWLLIPMVRRILDLSSTSPAADPLSVLPFLATGMLALLELREVQLDRRARTVLGLAGAAFLIGLPIGLIAEPTAAVFAAMAYCAGLSALILGWTDQVRLGGGATLRRTFLILLPPLALYGVAQYLFPLSSWDHHWVQTAGVHSIGAPEAGHIRVFSTLNSYFTLAIVLAIGILFALGEGRRSLLGRLALVPLILALVFTFNRSAWLGLVIGMLVFVAVGRRQAASRVVVGVVVCLAALVVLGNSNPTTRAFTERVTSLGAPGKDVSTQERLATTERLLPQSIRQPVGAGLGQAGIAAERLGGSEEASLVDVDDNYLALAYQSGPFALALLLVALAICIGAAAFASTHAEQEQRPERGALLAILVMLVILTASGEVLFGISGAIFWYLCGVALATRAAEEARLEADPEARMTVRQRPTVLVQSRAHSG